ncbi:MAG TPA: hypothetical protein VHQ70_02865 [Syntrophomonadaceae bacterium]|nr:hypothetical protein [Syntrophomonadaceae bacterium]
MKVLAGCLCLIFIVSLSGCQSTATKDKSNPVSKTGAVQKQDPGKLISKGKSVTNFSCTVDMTDANSRKTTSKMWIKSGSLRFETANPADGSNMVTIVNQADKTMYIFQPAQNTAMKMAIDQSKLLTGPQDQLTDLDSNDLKFIKQELYEGKKCAVYESGEGTNQETIWLWIDKGIPLRVETTAEGGKMIMEYRDYSFDKIDDTLFTIPAGTQIMDMGAMPNLVPKQ